MPDAVLIGKASVAAALVAAALVLVCGWPWKAPHPARVSAGGAAGVGLGLAIGAWLLGVVPHFPPREDQDRLLLILLPAVILVEMVAAVFGRAAWLAWSLRLIVAAAAARILLHDSIYLADKAGPGTREWSPQLSALILSSLALVLAAAWALIDRLARHAAGRAAPLTLAGVCAGAAVTVMLSGYATGGQLGLPLAGGLAGAAAASFVLKDPDLRGVIGVGLVGLFALLVVGLCFGELTALNAALLLAAPQLGWLVELPRLRQFGPRVRAGAGVALAAVPVAVVLVLAAQRFAAESASPSEAGGARETSIEDYMNFGK